MRVQFSKDYYYTPSGERRVTFHYKASDKAVTVKREAGEAAVAGGFAVEVEGGARDEDDAEPVAARKGKTKGAVGSASPAESPEDMKKILAAEQADG